MINWSDSPDVSPSRTRSGSDTEQPSLWNAVLSIALYILSTLHTWLAWKVEWVNATAFSVLCFSARTGSRQAVVPDDTAVIVMGGGEGVGRMLSLKLASAGYTVFACLPHDVPTPVGGSSSSSISPLLYIWQSRKARNVSEEVPGTIVPLVFDASLADDCERAKDTITAYCDQHSVSLRTLIVPPIAPSPDRSGSQSGAISPATSVSGVLTRWKPMKGRLSPAVQLVQMTQTTLHEAMSRCIFQPLGMVQALAGMLHENRSQVIFLSGCDETSFRSPQGVNALCDAAREQTAGTLQSELGPLGIRVSHIVVGPLQRKAAKTAYLPHRSRDTRQLLAMLSLVWAIDDHTCYGLIRRVIEAPYPRSTYRFGLDVLLQDAASSYIPTGVADIVKRVLPDSQSFT